MDIPLIPAVRRDAHAEVGPARPIGQERAGKKYAEGKKSCKKSSHEFIGLESSYQQGFSDPRELGAIRFASRQKRSCPHADIIDAACRLTAIPGRPAPFGIVDARRLKILDEHRYLGSENVIDANFDPRIDRDRIGEVSCGIER